MKDANPIQRHGQAIADARKYLAEIGQAIDEMAGNATHGPINWATVGDAGRLRDELKEVADRLKGR